MEAEGGGWGGEATADVESDLRLRVLPPLPRLGRGSDEADGEAWALQSSGCTRHTSTPSTASTASTCWRFTGGGDRDRREAKEDDSGQGEAEEAEERREGDEHEEGEEDDWRRATRE